MSSKSRGDWDPVTDEDEGARPQPGKPNAYWADVRAHQAAEEAREASLGYGSEYRAVPGVKGGQRSVRPDQTMGDYDLCWCGEPADHDWPGKDRGRKHPRPTTRKAVPEMSSTPAEAPHIERKHLRTFHEGLVDVIIRAVNDYGVRYRLSNNGCILYPPDGSQPYTIYARNTDRQVRQSRKWFVEHVIGTEGARALIRDQNRILDDMDIREQARRLAESIGGEEHEAPKETSDERRARKAREAQERAEQMAAAEAARKEAEAAQQPDDFTARENTDIPTSPEEIPEGWRPWANRLGHVNEHYITDGTGLIKCIHCGWETRKAQGVSGHYLTHHSPEHAVRLWGEAAQNKKSITKREQKIEAQVGAAIDLLNGVIGRSGQDTKQFEAKIDELVAELADVKGRFIQSQKELTAALTERDEAIKLRDEAQARLDLLREALQV